MDNKDGLLEVYIRFSKAERKTVKEVAKSENIDLCDWLRLAIGCKLNSDGYDGSIFFAPPVSEGE